jgi:hypothetical protein
MGKSRKYVKIENLLALWEISLLFSRLALVMIRFQNDLRARIGMESACFSVCRLYIRSERVDFP